MKIVYNGEILDESDSRVSILSPGFNYGDGFFTTIKVINKNPKLFDLHLERIKKSLSFYEYDLKLPNFNQLILELLEINDLNNSRLKIIFFRDVSKISYIIYCNNLTEDSKPIELTLSKFIRGDEEIHRYKSLNYYSNLHNPYTLFKDWEDRVLETGFANIFMIKDDHIFTPPITLPILPGVYRSFLLGIENILGYKIREKEITVKELYSADGIFLTNSIREILPVKSFNKSIISTKIPVLIRKELCLQNH